jgi:hypothetical protein
MNPNTSASGRAGVNTKWQMIFGAILLAAVILAVIVLVSSSLNGGVLATPSPTASACDRGPFAFAEPDAHAEPDARSDQRSDHLLRRGDQGLFNGRRGKIQLMASVYPRDITAEVTWSVENEEIATVDETGLVTGVSTGTTTIIAESYGMTTSCVVRVK